jgi:cell division septum initiation protein DivIVA
MISTRIDGSAPSNQLFDLLTVVSKPEVYQAKLKKLEDAIEENKKLIALVGPASDVLALKKKAQEDAAAAQEALTSAKTKAQGVVADATAEAAAIVSKAKAEAEALLEDAKATQAEVKNALKAAKSAQTVANKAQADAETQSVRAQFKADELDVAIAAAKQAEQAARDIRQSIIEKHQAFIASL